MELFLVRPFDVVKKQIEDNYNLALITNTVMNYLSNNFVLSKNYQVELRAEPLSWDEQTLLKDFFKRLGWKIFTIQKGELTKVVVSELN